MITLDPSAEPTKARRRPAHKATKPKAETKVKVGFYISAESARRLGVTSAMDGMDRSQIIDDLIRTHLRKYVVQVRSPRSEDLASITEEVSAA